MRQITLPNLGRHFEEEWPALCARLEELRQDEEERIELRRELIRVAAA